jgi:hypothetical protein
MCECNKNRVIFYTEIMKLCLEEMCFLNYQLRWNKLKFKIHVMEDSTL